MGKMDHYLNYTTQALAIREKIFEKEHPDIALSLYKCAIGHYNLDDETNFFKNAKKSITLFEKINGSENVTEIANLYQAMAIFYYKKNEYENFFEFSTKALNLRQNLHLDPHPSLVLSNYFVARAFGCIGDTIKEEFYLLRTLKMKKIILDTHKINVSLDNASSLIFENTPGVLLERSVKRLEDSLEHRHIMICSHPESKDMVQRFKTGLQSHGYQVLINDNDSSTKSLDKMFDQIENSGAFLICIDKHLNQDKNNKLEILFAAEIDIPMIAIKMDDMVDFQEWLSNLLANKKLFDSKHIKNFDLFIRKLAREVELIRI